MPAPIVSSAAKITCAHRGQVTLIPKQVTVIAGGSPALCVGDLVGAPIVGCAQPPTPATAPCLVVASEGATLEQRAPALARAGGICPEVRPNGSRRAARLRRSAP